MNTKTEKKMNIKLLRKIQDKIMEEPRQFDMSDWFTHAPGIPNCGTAACIGGWAIALHTEKTPSECHIHDIAPEDALALDSEQEDNLFYTSSWPEPWKSDYENAMNIANLKKAAQVASDYIDFFIKVDGKWYCQDHPKYKGKTLPKNDCSGCHFVFKEKRDLFKLTKTK